MQVAISVCIFLRFHFPMVPAELQLQGEPVSLPELPEAMRARFVAKHGLTPYEAAALTASRDLADYYETAVAMLSGGAKLAASWVMGELSAALNRGETDVAASKVTAERLAGMLKRVMDNTISGKMAKDVFDAMWAGEGDADAIIDRKGLRQISDEGAIEKIVDDVIAANPAIVAEFRAGREKAFNSLVGKAMAATKGKANPAQVNAILRRKLGA